jgi:hypothetical protein
LHLAIWIAPLPCKVTQFAAKRNKKCPLARNCEHFFAPRLFGIVRACHGEASAKRATDLPGQKNPFSCGQCTRPLAIAADCPKRMHRSLP